MLSIPTIPALSRDTANIKRENHWKRRMLPKWLLSLKGRTCNPTPHTLRHGKENNLFM